MQVIVGIVIVGIIIVGIPIVLVKWTIVRSGGIPSRVRGALIVNTSGEFDRCDRIVVVFVVAKVVHILQSRRVNRIGSTSNHVGNGSVGGSVGGASSR
jgi:hypothetical protein